MHLRTVRALLAACASLAVAAPAAAQRATAVYGLELEVGAERERLLVFAEAPLEPELIEVDERTLMLALPGAVLDPTAPRTLVPEAQGTVRRVTAFERAGGGGAPEVRVVVQRRPGAAPALERRASLIALDFEPLRAPGAAAADETVSIAYRNAPIARVVRDIARATGETFIVDDSLAGSVSIEGPARATRGEALALLDSILLLRNRAAVPSPGGARKIVEISGAEGPWVPIGSLGESDELVATLLRVESADAASLLTALGDFFGAQTVGVAFAPTNSLILAGPASQLRRIRTAVEAVDRSALSRPLLWRLHYADAETVAGQVREILGDAAPTVTADLASNALLLRVRPGEIERARRLVRRLDRPALGRGELHVIPLDYADPVELSERLVALRDDLAGVRDVAVALAEARRAGLRGREFVLAADPATNSLLVQALPEAFAAVLDVVRELDRVPDSVRVDLTIATVVLEDGLELGIDFLLPLTDPRRLTDPLAAVAVSSSGGLPPRTPSTERPFLFNYTRSNPVTLPILNPLTGEEIVINAGESVSLTLNDRVVRTETLMRPRLLVIGGEEHEIFAGDNVPIPVASGETPENAPVSQVRRDIQREDVGTRVRLRPTVGAEGRVQLELEIEQSEIGPSLAGSVAVVGPSIRKTELTSRILLRPGEAAVIATHAEPLVSRRESGVPWLKDVPILGWLFRSTRDVATERHLLVAVAAEVISAESRELSRALSHELGAATATR